MGKNYYKKTKHYSFVELCLQAKKIKENYDVVEIKRKRKRKHFEVFVDIQPTEYSKVYKVKLVGKVDSKVVNVFVINPKVEKFENDKKVPHLYKDGSLCLFYPDYNEWNYTDFWAETLLPWTSLWLYYYEIWQSTGEWLGGGIHNK